MTANKTPAALALALVVALAAAPTAAAQSGQRLVLGAWNIEHLAARDGSGCRPRDAAEYAAARRYLKRAGADVIAFQEVENETAAERLFPAAEYALYLSSRPSLDLGKCRESGNRRLMQRTGFAVRRDSLENLGLRVVRKRDVKSLAGTHGAGRWGVHLVLTPRAGRRAWTPAAGAPLHLLSIHLKSGCPYQRIQGAGAARHCAVLNGQATALAAWIRKQAGRGENFIVLGDFNRQLDQLSDTVWLRLEGRRGARRYVDLEKALHGIKHPRPRNKRYPFAIDHIVYNQAMDALALETESFFDTTAGRYSDHLPLFVAFETAR